MIGYPADGQCFYPILACDPSEIGPEAFANRGGQRGHTAFSAEDGMHQTAMEGVHGSFVP